MANQPNYYCLHCPHSGAMHGGPKMSCGGLDGAGDTCDCGPFVPDLSRPPMEERKPVKVKSIDRKPTNEQHEKNLAIIERYRLIRDANGEDYVIPVHATQDFYASPGKFASCRIDGGVLTFTDPKVG